MSEPVPAKPHLLRPAPLRLAIFTGNYCSVEDGVAMTLKRLVEYLEGRGHSVLVVAPGLESGTNGHGESLVPIPSLPAPGRPEYRMALGLTPSARKRIDEFRPTLFHIATPDFLGLGALRLGRKRGIPVVGSFHTHFASYLRYYELDMFREPLWKYLRYFYQRCEQVYVPSRSMMKVLRDRDVGEDLRLWDRGVDSEFFNPRHRSSAWRQSHSIADDEVVVTFVGRLAREKGLKTLVEVIRRLEANGVPHRSMVIGDGPERGWLTTQLRRTVFTGYLTGGELARGFAASDVFLFPSDTETFGNVTLQAMASGLPTVCANATGSDALVQHGTTGFLAEPTNTEQFLDYTTRLVANPGLRTQMARAALRRSQQYAWPTSQARLESYYRELVEFTTEHPESIPAPPLAAMVPEPARAAVAGSDG